MSADTSGEHGPVRIPYHGMRSPKRVAHAVRDARRAAGLTQAELAAAAGVTRETVCAIESGRTATGLKVLSAVLARLGYDIAFLPTGDA